MEVPVFNTIKEKRDYWAQEFKKTKKPRNIPVKRDPSLRLVYNKYNVYKSRSNRFGREFSLTEEQFITLMNQDCIYCGDPGGTIDRKDSLIGYTIDNSQPCCLTCNTMKMHIPHDVFVKQINKIHQNLTCY